MTSQKKTIGRRLFGLVMVLALMLTMLLPGTTASAAPTISTDPEQKGSITIYKYDGTALSEEEYLTQEEMKDLIEEDQRLPEDERTLEAMKDVVFTILKVGEVGQSDADSTTSEVVIGYSITNSGLLNLLQGTGVMLDTAFSDNGTTYYTTESLQNALSRLTQTQLENFIKAESDRIEMDATDEFGRSYKDELDLGLYLVVETGYPAEVTRLTIPFFVSIPMTDSSEEGGYTWIYDVTCYPKNSQEEFKISKSVVEDDTESGAIDGEIGQKKQFVIRADVPDTIGVLTEYTIADTLSEGLTFSSSDTPTVRGLKSDGDYDTLGATEYTFTPSRNPESTQDILTFSFTPSELAIMDENNNQVAEYVMIEITYFAYLNENATVGGDGNGNDAELIYKTSTSGGTISADSPAIYTYGIELQKLFNGEEEGNFSDVTFELYRDAVEDDNKLAVAYDEVGGYWYITGETDSSNQNHTLSVNAENGKLLIHGLEAGTYYLVETGTDEGYNLLESAIEIVITSNEGSDGYYKESNEGTYAKYVEGTTYYLDSDRSIEFVMPTYVQDGKWINFGTSTVYTDSDTVTMFAPGELEWSATVGGSEVTDDDGIFGTVNVNNTSGFRLPQTGGSGTFWFLVGGGVVVIAAIAVIVAVTRKKGGARAD